MRPKLFQQRERSKGYELRLRTIYTYLQVKMFEMKGPFMYHYPLPFRGQLNLVGGENVPFLFCRVAKPYCAVESPKE